MSFFVLVGLAVAAFGIFLIVQGVQGNNAFIRTAGGVAVIAGVVFALLAGSFVVVPAGRVGVVFNVLGGVSDRERNPGVQFVMPGLQQMTLLNTREQSIEFITDNNDEIPALSQEGLQIVSDATVRYRIEASEASSIFESIGDNVEATLIRPQVRSVIRNAIANYNAAEVISTQRGELQAEIVQVLTDELAANNIILLDVLLRDIRIPDSITQAIEEKQAAEQQIEVETNRREQSRIAAERVVIQAEGERDAEIARAQGEAEALRLRGQAIRENPEIIQLEVAQKLAPSLQTILLPAEGNFLLDLRSLTERQAP
jgi:regulator of protease activity HflC (stomatin/prohibitin superfamily)